MLSLSAVATIRYHKMIEKKHHINTGAFTNFPQIIARSTVLVQYHKSAQEASAEDRDDSTAQQ